MTTKDKSNNQTTWLSLLSKFISKLFPFIWIFICFYLQYKEINKLSPSIPELIGFVIQFIFKPIELLSRL